MVFAEYMPLVEREMLQLSYVLRSKSFWWSKFRDPEIAAKWRAEALAQARRMRDQHIDYVLQELDGYANLRDRESGVEKFQWLPTDFDVSEDGKSVKSVSYINNLHPDEHRDLHLTIEKFSSAFLPLFVWVLTDMIPQNKITPVRTTNDYSYGSNNQDPKPEYEAYNSDNEFDQAHEAWSARRPVSPPDVNPKRYVPGKLELRCTSYELAGKTVQIIVKLANIHLVSVAQLFDSAILTLILPFYTPEKSSYGGGSWHVEGMSNEAIAASGIYYYDEENITESRLALRATARPSENYEEDDTRGCMKTWGIGRLVFYLNPYHRKLSTPGAVITRQDWAITFPNIYQHKFSPFELKDKSKPGRRKFVALFLLDPAVHRPSTTEVPQRQDWITPAALANPILKRPSVEIISHISALIDSSMTRKEAELFRVELMNERKAFVIRHDEKFSGLPLTCASTKARINE
ncbi:hypothetical protein RhiJN_20116 [Ceratobasidium sp. AG-Ba]|nr:hypothetical protein RhiJN_20116 [Ceratobasidium sp. AG-Ba]